MKEDKQRDTINDVPPRFKLKAGEIEGWYDGNVIRVTGVPYAQAERFAKPSSLPADGGFLAANQWSPACPQFSDTFSERLLGGNALGHLSYKEDCLALSLTLPRIPENRKKWPVMVWIHGGSYTSGAGDATVFDPKLLVEEQGILVVNINYRLGVFGFLGGVRIAPLIWDYWI